MQLCVEYIHEEQIRLCTIFNQQFKCCQLPTAHSLFQPSDQNVCQLQQHMIEDCCEMIRLP